MATVPSADTFFGELLAGTRVMALLPFAEVNHKFPYSHTRSSGYGASAGLKSCGGSRVDDY